MKAFVLIPSPLAGPLTWSPVAQQLRRRGFEALAPTLQQDEEASEPLWMQQARCAATSLRAAPPASDVVLVGHSGAGQILPAVRHEADRPVAAYVFVDAGLPHDGQARLGSGAFAEQLRQLYARGERFPNWTDEDLRAAIPDQALRRGLLAQLQPQPRRFWDEPIPVFAGWPDAPCAYLRFAPNPAYDAAADEARRRGWPYAELSGGHFHMLVDPTAVTEALLDLARGTG